MAVSFLLLAGRGGAVTFRVTANTDSGAGTLREALVRANASPGKDSILFDRVDIITLQSDLPFIEDAVVIDGTGADVTINGGGQVALFQLWSGEGSVIKGLNIINGSYYGVYAFLGEVSILNNTFRHHTVSIQVDGATNAIIQGNTIDGGFYGIVLNTCSGGRIGGSRPGEGNTIRLGVFGATITMYNVMLTGCSDVDIQGNTLGSNEGAADDTYAIILYECQKIRVGGRRTGEGNHILYMYDFGIYLEKSSFNSILQNFMAVTPPIPEAGEVGTGICLINSSDNVIGGTGANEANHLAYFEFTAMEGINVDGQSQRNRISGNRMVHPLLPSHNRYVTKGINLNTTGNGGKTSPVVNGLAYLDGQLTLSGSAQAGDTVEVFETDSLNRKATFAGFTVATATGAWTYRSPALGAVAYYKATARDAAGNTSEFSAPAGRSNLVQGQVYLDRNGNCTRDPEESVLPNTLIQAEPGPYFASTDAVGRYTLLLPAGSFKVSQLVSTRQHQVIRQSCPAPGTAYPVLFAGRNEVVAGKDFGNTATDCPVLLVDLGESRRRRCFAGTTTVRYRNVGLASAREVVIRVKFPAYVIPKSSTLPWTAREGSDTYVFKVGSLEPNAEGMFMIRDSVACASGIVGLTQCTEAAIALGNACGESNADWSGASLAVGGQCENGTARLVVRNLGVGDMADSTGYRVFADDALVHAGNVKLTAGDSLVLALEPAGQTLRLEADQVALHPGTSRPSCSLEACGRNAAGGFSTGYVTHFAAYTAPGGDVSCKPIVDSYDPNDKSVSPQGTAVEHVTPPGQELTFQIRFQNMGSDTAYTVVVVDTLSEYLDFSTLRLDQGSHPYKFSLSGRGQPVLTWTFSCINLSTKKENEAASQGYVSFRISPKVNLPDGTVVTNFADIYFDLNDPVRTNATLNTLSDRIMAKLGSVAVRLQAPLSTEPLVASPAFRVFPNPARDVLRIQAEGLQAGEAVLTLHNLLGRPLLAQKLLIGLGMSNELSVAHLPKGIYLLQLHTKNRVWRTKVLME